MIQHIILYNIRSTAKKLKIYKYSGLFMVLIIFHSDIVIKLSLTTIGTFLLFIGIKKSEELGFTGWQISNF